MTDILNLEWYSHPSRDREAATLVCNELRDRGYSVAEASMFRGIEAILQHKPKLVFVGNPHGADMNHRVVQFAKRCGCSVVGLMAEGNWREDSLPEAFWGWNRERKLYLDIACLWSDRARDLLVRYCPNVEYSACVTGAVGFDRYKLARFMSKSELLGKYGKGHYQKVLGVGCWDFGPCDPAHWRYRAVIERVGMIQAQRFREDGRALNAIMRRVVKDNPQVLFLFKLHPGNMGDYYAAGIDGIEGPNVLVAEEGVADCINASDIWLVYNSTTLLEAWLLGKPTVVLNPSGPHFPREELWHGSPVAQTVEGLQAWLEAWAVPGFAGLADVRKTLIRDTIGHDDGRNHVRAAKIVQILLRDALAEWHPPLDSWYHLARERALWHLSRWFRWLYWKCDFYYKASRRWDDAELAEFTRRRAEEQAQWASTGSGQRA